jgi:hypothetical protein
MKRLVIFILLSILLTGSITQTYNQKLDSLGNSKITESRDISFFLGLLPEGSLEKINTVCSTERNLDCSLENTTLTMSMEMDVDNNYYELETDNGFPFITTTLTINLIPTDLFDERINSILLSANLVSESESAKPIDLTESNSARAAALRNSGFEVTYIVEMPNGEKTSFDLLSVYEDTKPIVVQTTELNTSLVLVAIGIILVVFVSASFFGKKRNMHR